MSIGGRPYVGSWEIGSQTVVRHTPDARVLINGHAEFATCATCNKKLDLNQYVTNVSCDPTTDPISSASVSLAIPKHQTDVFSHDGNYVLRAGLEVVIQMRGYFPVTGYAAKGQDESEDANDDIPVYPYYQVFRGVVTEVSHEFSGGFYTASLTCSNVLHFWQYQYLSTQGAVFAKKPSNAGINVDLTGHTFTGMDPYAIMYTLMRVGFGAAYGVNWTISTKSNISAVDESSGESLYKQAALWWEKRWQDSSMRLRMYGFDGSLFNAFEQAYLGLFNVKGNAKKGARFIKSFGVSVGDDYNFNASVNRARTARAFGYRGTETTAAVLDDKGFKLNPEKMQAYTLDLGSLAQPNFFETEYMSKLEIANAVKEITGFEFYQDVDGDIVFKPPFYNLDTSDDPVYVIEDRDLLSISESEREPEATYIKGAGAVFQNFQGVLSGEFGTRQGKFVDWRLVAQFGWREATFDSHYYSGAKQMFIGAIMRFDMANVEMRSAQITIPLRPEIRPGYPVYVRSSDCFYYIKNMSHSFAPGSSCQTTLSCVAKRAKFLPPGLADRSTGDGSRALPTLDDVRLDAPGEYPPLPLYVYDRDVGDDASEGSGPSGPPRIMGYPNVVMALDPEKINPRILPGNVRFGSGDTFFDTALSLGVLRRDPDDPKTYLLSVDDSTSDVILVTKEEVIKAFDDLSEAITTRVNAGQSAKEINQDLGQENTSFGVLLEAVEQRLATDVEDSENLSRYMSLQTNLKSVFGASSEAEGQYRYYSSSAPNIEDQSPSEVIIDGEQGIVNRVNPGAPETLGGDGTITVLRQTEGGRVRVESGVPDRGFRVYGLNPVSDDDGASGPYSDVTTRDIRFVNFSRFVARVKIDVQTDGVDTVSEMMLDLDAMRTVITSELVQYAEDQSITDPVAALFGEDAEGGVGYKGIYDAIVAYAEALGVADTSKVAPKVSALATFANSFSAFTVSSTAEEQVLRDPANPDDLVGLDETQVFLLEEALRSGTSPQDPGLYKTVSTTTTRSRRKSGTLRQVTGGRGVNALRKLAKRSADGLANLLGTVQTTYRLKISGPTASDPRSPTDEEVAARLTFLQSFAGYTEEKGSGAKILATTYKDKPKHTLVLPVSDNRGYEVYGSLAYGRGLDIRTYRGILERAGTPANAESLLAIERFFAETVVQGGDVAKALARATPETKAALAASLETNEAGLADTVEKLIADSESESIFIRNTPVTSRSRGMSYTEGVSARELADLTGDGGQTCICRGAEADIFLQAFTGDFIPLGGSAGEDLNEFLLDEAERAGQGYKVTKQALAGQVLDTRYGNRLAQIGKQTGDAALGLRNTAVSDYEQAREEVNQAAQAVRDAASAFQPDDTDEGEG